MNTYTFLLGGVLPYLALLVFVVGLAYRFYVWFKTPQPAKVTLYPWPEGSMLKNIVGEVLFFPGLFKGDRVLWTFSWVFHASLALVFVGHCRVFSGLLDRLLLGLGVSAAGITWMSSTLGGAAGIVMAATAVLLIGRRLAVQRAREISVFADYFALLLLVAIIVTGDVMRFGTHFELNETRVWAASLLAFKPVVPKNPVFLTHLALALVLVMFIPFSKILHFGGIFFTQALMHRR
ncbi:MAG: respiratory nitrate reductase subunit gamma [Deltaproteobacteria bacterium]|nr:respiratory nitrate reductase subunit gamma [Deltaproteobacteria bacterium]